jgi:plastocyanin
MKFRSSTMALVVIAVAATAIAGCGSSSSKSTSASASNAAGSAAAAGASAAAGKAGSTGGTGAVGSATSDINISADPTGALKFIPTTLTVAAGKHNLVFTNKSSLTHDVIIGKGFSEGGQVGEVKRVSNGTSVSKKPLDLKPGTYSFYCDVSGHRQSGMVGKLVVTQ